MKKKKIFLGLALATAAVLCLGSCKNDANETTSSVIETTDTKDTTDTTTNIDTTYTIKFMNGDTEYKSSTVKKGEAITAPETNPTKEDTETVKYVFNGWYTSKNGGEKVTDFGTADGDKTYYAIFDEYEIVSYSLDAEKLDAGNINKKIGQFTIQGEVRGRTKSWTNPEDSTDTLSWTKSFKNGPIAVYAPGNGTLDLYAQNGSGSAVTKQMSVEEKDADGKVVSTSTLILAGTQAVAPYPSGSPVMKFTIEVKEGHTYTFARGDGGTIDWYQFDMTCTVQKSDVNGFEISDTGDINFLVGEEYTSEKLGLIKTFANGKTDTLDLTDVIIDSSAFDKTKSGTYEIKVTYSTFGTKTYNVNVWDVDSIKLGFNATYKGSSTSAGNGQYINGKVKTLYTTADNLDTNYLSVIAIAKLGDKTEEFLINNRSSKDNIAFGDVTLSSEGEKEVNVSYTANSKTLSASYKVNVVDTEPVKNAAGEYIVNVNANYTGTAGAADATLGNQFKTIYDALQFLSRENVDTATRKILKIEAGTYNEKLEVTIPYLTIVGAGQSQTLIEWDSLYGTPDASGYLQVTDSTQTLAIRETAIGCIIQDITISNWWNSEERFTSAESIAYLTKHGLYTTKVNEHRALALLVMSDKFIMNNVSLLGYQDTVELFKGRQYLKDCYISGTTDFIFGTNNTTFFDNCEIHTIYNGSTSGGYTTAFKGSSAGETDYVQYGAIFYQCEFTADSEVGTGENANTALGRTWGAYAAVAFIECEFGNHISKKASSGASQNERYVAMQNCTATDKTVKFVEYGNTGEGAISATQAGMTYLDATTAANYYDYSVIFGTTNGKVTYTDVWNPADSTIKEDKSSYYFFNGSTSATGTVYSSELQDTNSITEKKFTIGDITFDASSAGRVMARTSGDLMVTSGATVSFDVKAGTLVTIISYPGYYFYTINGIEANANTVTQYYEADTTITLASTGSTFYLFEIIINPEPENVETAELTAINLSGYKDTLNVGDTFTAGDIVVKGEYTDGTKKVLDSSNYQIDSSAVDMTTAGDYTVIVKVGTVTKSYTLTVEVASTETAIIKTTKLDFTSADAVNKALSNAKVDYTNATITSNNDNASFNGSFSFEVKAGAIVYILPYKTYGNFKVMIDDDNTDLSNYTSTYKYEAETDCKITIIADGQNYISQVGITYPISADYSWSFRTDTTNGDEVTNTYNLVDGFEDGLYINAKAGKFAPRAQQWAQFNAGTIISFTVEAGAKVTIACHEAKYTVNGTAATNGTTEITTNTTTTITIEATDNTYIDYITIDFE